MDCRWRYAEKALNINFGGCPLVDLRVVVNKCQILALFLGILRHSAILLTLNGLPQSEVVPFSKNQPKLNKGACLLENGLLKPVDSTY